MKDAHQFLLHLEFSEEGPSLTFQQQLRSAEHLVGWQSKDLHIPSLCSISRGGQRVAKGQCHKSPGSHRKSGCNTWCVLPSWPRGGDSCGNEVEKWWHTFWCFQAGKLETKKMLELIFKRNMLCNMEIVNCQLRLLECTILDITSVHPRKSRLVAVSLVSCFTLHSSTKIYQDPHGSGDSITSQQNYTTQFNHMEHGIN